MDYKTEANLLHLYEKLLVTRLYEEHMIVLLKQNKISKWFSSIGQEAISVGATLAIQPDDYILPAHRNLGVFVSREIPLDRLTAQIQGKAEGFTQGRDRSFHFGSLSHHIIGMISHMAAHLPVAAGVALGCKIKKENNVVLTFCGEGATSQGDFHEALNIASVWRLPIIFVIENNGWSISTPNSEQFACKQLADKGIGYGIQAYQVDGNNVMDVFQVIANLRQTILQNPQPILVEAITYRVRGHEEASGTAYMPTYEIEQWKQKDPLMLFQKYLLENHIITQKEIDEKRRFWEDIIHQQIQKGLQSPEVVPNPNEELADVYAPFTLDNTPSHIHQTPKRFIDAISQALAEALDKIPELILMGQDIAEYGGVFKVTQGFVERFGKERIRNTPLCESAVVGMALGLSAVGVRSVIEIQYADFVSCAFNQVVNNLAKSYYRWKLQANTVIRLPVGGSIGAGPFHSQTVEAWFAHVPGLHIYYPAFPDDAHGLLHTAIAQPNPVLFLEHKALYRTVTSNVPAQISYIEHGKALVRQEGNLLTIIAYGLAVHWVLEKTQDMQGIEIIDLRTIIPWDKETVKASVQKTGKVLICHEDTLTGGFGAEIAAWIAQNCFEYLDAPIIRVASQDTPIPFARNLEQHFLASAQLETKIRELLAY